MMMNLTPSTPQKFLFNTHIVLDPVENAPSSETDVHDPLADICSDLASSVTLEVLDWERHQAFERGLTQGRQEIQSSLDTQNALWMDTMTQHLEVLVEYHHVKHATLHTHLATMVMAMLTQLLPDLERALGEHKILQCVQYVLNDAPTQGGLKIFAHPDHLTFLQENLTSTRALLSYHGDESLGYADCRLEWEDGGIECCINTILSKIADLIAQHATLAPPTPSHSTPSGELL